MKSLLVGILSVLLISSASQACRGGNQMAIYDSAGKSIGLLVKNIVADQKKNSAEIKLESDFVVTYWAVAASGIIYDKSSFNSPVDTFSVQTGMVSRNAALQFSVSKSDKTFVGVYSVSIDELQRQSRSGGCGGTVTKTK